MAEPRILLIHGALGSAAQMRPLADALGRGAETVELPGHGSSAGTGQGFSMAHFARFIEGRLTAPTLIFGYSMGGYAALLTALTAPSHIQRIVTLGTKFDWTPEGAAKEAQMLHPERMQEKVPAFTQFLEKRHGAAWPTMVRETAALMTALGHAPPLTEESLARIPVPVTILRGSEDSMVSRQESEWAARCLPHARHAELAGQPHPFEKCDLEVIANALRKESHL